MASRWDDMTVAELRKYAREHGITLSAGINKQGIVERITSHEEGQENQVSPEAEPAPTEAAPVSEQPQRPVRKASIIADDDDESHEIGYGMGSYSRPSQDRPRYGSDPARPSAAPARGSDVLSTISSKAPDFRIDSSTKAWHNPRSFQPNNYHAPTAQPPQGAHNYGQPRAAEPARPAPANRPYEARPATAARPMAAPQRFGPAEPVQKAAEPTTARPESAAPEPVPVQEPIPHGPSWQNTRGTMPPAALRDFQSLGKPSVNELLATDESEDAEGVCVLLSDSTAYLYTDQYLDDETVIFLTAAQVRRFQLRMGDRVAGKIRGRRDGDKYRFMLYITGINGIPVDDVKNRASFESLHVIVPAKRLISLPLRTQSGEKGESASAPLLYGQRIFAQANGLEPLAAAHAIGRQIQESKPNARIIEVTIHEAPEDTALARAAASWTILTAEPSSQLEKQRQTLYLVASRAMRLAEQKTDVVLLVSCSHTMEPSENTLYEPLLALFASGRTFKEGGSLTTILLTPDAPDARFARAASQTLTVIPEDGQGVAALDGSVNVRAFQIFV